MKIDWSKFKTLSSEKKKKLLISFGKYFHSIENRRLTSKDLGKFGITYQHIYRLFGSLYKLNKLCGIDMQVRKIKMSDDEIRQYLKEIKETNQNGCWLTSIYADKDNRPRIWYKGKKVYLYRLSYLLFKGSLPQNRKKIVGHTCDDSRCFRPEHLEIITPRQNNLDSINRGRRQTRNNMKNVKRARLNDPYDYKKLLAYVRTKITITDKNEWLWNGRIPNHGYPTIGICGKQYSLHRLILANKIDKKYEDIETACHRLPDNSKPVKHDLNPDHLFEGTPTDNANDTLSYRKNCKVTLEITKYIKDEFVKVDSLKKGSVQKFDQIMAEEFDIGAPTVKQIRLGNSYRIYDDRVVKATKEKLIIQLDKKGNFIAEYGSASKAANILKISQPNISKACINRKLYKGFMWHFKDDGESYEKEA